MRRARKSLIAGIAAAILLAAVPGAFAVLYAAPAAPANCVRNQLSVRSNGTSGAAGTIHEAWVFTNLSSKTCHLYGYPGMQLYGRSGRPIPTTVLRSLRPRPNHVTLASGASATKRSACANCPSLS